MRTILTTLFAFLLVASLAFAAGTSTGSGIKGKNNNTSNETMPTSLPIRHSFVGEDCEGLDEMKNRIQCRLENKIELPTKEESCKGLANEQLVSCAKLYTTSKDCYTKTGQDKDACFRNVVGITHSTLKGNSSNKTAVKEYMILVLYDLQERVEEAQEAGTIDAGTAADLITRIVEAKQTILQNKSTSEIRTAINSVKVAYRGAMQ
jgi:hypothetical protein